MPKINDNKLEDIFLKIILSNSQINWEIIKFYDLINNQKISLSDKKIIIDKILGILIVNEKEEIDSFLKTIRNEDMEDKLLYKVIFELIESIFDINDKKHLILLLSNTKENIETDIIYFLKDIFDLLYMKTVKYLKKKNNLVDLFSKDYLSNNELNTLLNEIEILFKDITIEIINSKKKIEIQNKIKQAIEKNYKILSIK